mmetsp:Transcript_19093/g.72168  ORF Transcript_19093/g.72168 Transcript_19093/m.72168 type:complete len:532 (-) Transcript_19093:348-1943(-)
MLSAVVVREAHREVHDARPDHHLDDLLGQAHHGRCYHVRGRAEEAGVPLLVENGSLLEAGGERQHRGQREVDDGHEDDAVLALEGVLVQVREEASDQRADHDLLDDTRLRSLDVSHRQGDLAIEAQLEVVQPTVRELDLQAWRERSFLGRLAELRIHGFRSVRLLPTRDEVLAGARSRLDACTGIEECGAVRGGNLLEVVGQILEVGTAVSEVLEVRLDPFAGAVIDDLTMVKEHHVVKELDHLRCRLQQADQGGEIEDPRGDADHEYLVKGGRGVQASRYLIREERAKLAHEHLTSANAPLLAARDAPQQLVSNNGIRTAFETQQPQNVVNLGANVLFELLLDVAEVFAIHANQGLPRKLKSLAHGEGGQVAVLLLDVGDALGKNESLRVIGFVAIVEDRPADGQLATRQLSTERLHEQRLSTPRRPKKQREASRLQNSADAAQQVTFHLLRRMHHALKRLQECVPHGADALFVDFFGHRHGEVLKADFEAGRKRASVLRTKLRQFTEEALEIPKLFGTFGTRRRSLGNC